MHLYALAALVAVFVLAQSLFFLIRAVRQSLKEGLDPKLIRRTILSSAVFSIAPSAAILLGVIALSKGLGLPIAWLRLNVLGALTYELPAATTAAQVLGVSLSQPVTDPRQLTAILWVMTLGIIPGMFVVLFGLKDIQGRIHSLRGRDPAWGKVLTDSLFLGMIAAFVGMLFKNVRLGLPGFVPVAVGIVGAVCMLVCQYFIRKTRALWLEQYALPLSMVGGMAAAIPLSALMQ